VTQSLWGEAGGEGKNISTYLNPKKEIGTQKNKKILLAKRFR
jgi:hypothetical protein